MQRDSVVDFSASSPESGHLPSTAGELEELNARLDEIVETIQSLRFCTNVHEFGSRLLKEFARFLRATGGSMYLVLEDGLQLVHAIDPGHAPDHIEFPLREGSILERALSISQPVLIRDNAGLRQFSESGYKGYKDDSAIAFPLHQKDGKVIALISLHGKIIPPFIEQDKKLGAILASFGWEALRAVVAIEADRQRSAALEQSFDGIAITDLHGDVVFANKAWAQMHGYQTEELQGKHLSVFHTEHQMQTEIEPFNREVAVQGASTAELGHFRQDGTRFQARVAASILRDELGNPVGMVVNIHDITEKLKLEDQLRRAQKLESVGRMAGGIAHDFNNLLSPIIGYAEMFLLDISQQNPYHADVAQIKAAAESARDLTRQLLAFSRKQLLEIKTVNLSNVVSGFLKMIRRTVREDIELVSRIESSVGNINGDVSQIEQILMNLVVNAQDAMPRGGKMEIETSDVFLDSIYIDDLNQDMVPGEYVSLSVRDFGGGLDPETLKRIFEPFFTTKESGKGTGLGLSTVYGIVKQHSGGISVESEPDRGATFTIYFPRVNQTPDSVQFDTAQPRLPYGSETILVVEDNEMVRNLLRSMLSKYGYDVIVARDAEECCRVIVQRHREIHLLISDVVLPNMNGFELYEHLVSNLIPELKVLYISGYTDDIVAQNGPIQKKANFLQKPISVHALTGKVRKILDKE